MSKDEPPDGKPRGPWWRPAVTDEERAKEALMSASIQLEEAGVALMISCELLLLLAQTRPPRPADERAERRVLGWMLSGRSTPAELGELAPGYDFTSRGRRWLAGLALELVEGQAFGAIAADRATLCAMLEHVPADVGADVLEEIDRAPYVVAFPSRELDLVMALGRAWSVTDDAYRGAT